MDDDGASWLQTMFVVDEALSCRIGESTDWLVGFICPAHICIVLNIPGFQIS